jgi:hypothetical protein
MSCRIASPADVPDAAVQIDESRPSRLMYPNYFAEIGAPQQTRKERSAFGAVVPPFRNLRRYVRGYDKAQQYCGRDGAFLGRGGARHLCAEGSSAQIEP